MGLKLHPIIILFLSISANTQAFSLNFDYITGEEICRSEFQHKNEIAHWVSVPVSYDFPKNEKTLIYSYTKTEFNPELPSVLYFTGGPGSSSRGTEFSLPNANVIFFEQRGISCSRPKTKELFLDPSFYSSENTAKDALAILDAYKIEKSSIYGHSYGTVPATIFASFFPERTKSLILEGVISSADESLWISQRKIKNIQRYFDSLSLEKRNKILNFSKRDDVPSNWFSYFARMTLGVGNFENGLSGFLESTLFSKELKETELASLFTNMIPKVDTTSPAESNGYGEVMMGMIACQELSMADPNMSHLLIFKNDRLVPDRNNVDRKSMCEPLGLREIPENFYKAEDYPIDVPVTYLLGEFDPATSLDQGLEHFQKAKSKQKQALIMMAGGHTPNLEKLIEAGYCPTESKGCDEYKQQLFQRKMFQILLLGQRISLQQIEEFNSLGQDKWKFFEE